MVEYFLEGIAYSLIRDNELYCDNKAAINLAYNLVQHDRTRHIEVYRYVIKEKVESGQICIPLVTSREQLADVLTKWLPRPNFIFCVSKVENDKYL